jgi:hypothetical protein
MVDMKAAWFDMLQLYTWKTTGLPKSWMKDFNSEYLQ